MLHDCLPKISVLLCIKQQISIAHFNLSPNKQIGSSEVIPEAVCKVGGDICVYDSSETRLIMASSDGYKSKPLLDEDELGML